MKKFLYAGLLAVSTVAYAQSPSSDDVARLLTLQGSQTTLLMQSACSPGTLQREESDVASKIQLQDFVGAEAAAKVTASHLASCSLRSHQPLPLASFHVGEALAYQFLAGSITGNGIVTPQDEQAKKNALIFLQFAQANGERSAQPFLQKLKGGNEQQGAPSIGTPVLMTAKAAVESYEGNGVGFDMTYAGKLMTLTGPLRVISPLGDKAALTIVGIDRGDPDKERISDEVSCDVDDRASVASLAPKQTVRVTGIYDKVLSHGVGRITLIHCRVESH
jgi:hypothetical protein